MSSCPPYTNPPPTPYPRPKSYTKHWLPVGQKRFAHVSHMLGPGARGKLVEGTPCSSGFRGCSRSRVRVNTKLQGGHSSSLAQLIPGPSCWGFSEGLVRAVASSFAQVGRNSHMSRTCLEAGREGGKGGQRRLWRGSCGCIRHELHDLYELETREAYGMGVFWACPKLRTSTNCYELLAGRPAWLPGEVASAIGSRPVRDREDPPGMSCTSYGGAPGRRAPGVVVWEGCVEFPSGGILALHRHARRRPARCAGTWATAPPEPASEAPPRTADDTGPTREGKALILGTHAPSRSAVSNRRGASLFFREGGEPDAPTRHPKLFRGPEAQ